MTDLRDIIKIKTEHDRQFAREQILFEGIIVARNGTTKVPGVHDHVWVQPHGVGEPVSVYNRSVKGSRAGMGVQVGFAPLSTVLEILRDIITSTAGAEPTSGNSMQPHAESHFVDGDDPLYIHDNALMPLLTYTLGLSGLLVSVWSYTYQVGTGIVFFPGQSNVSLAAHEPAAGLARYVLIYLDIATNAILTTAGATIVDSPAFTPVSPAVPANSVPAALVRVAGGQTVISRSDIVPVRDFFYNPSRDGGGGGGWPFENALTVSTTNAAAGYSTIAAAITAAASAGDTIALDSETYSLTAQQAIGKSLTIEGQGPEQTIIDFNLANTACLDFTADNITVVFRNLTINHSAGGGTAAGVLFTNNAGVRVILDNCIVRKSGGAPTMGYGAWWLAGTLELRNGSKLLCTSGTSQYGIINDSNADVTLVIGPDCEVGGATADVYSNRAGSTLTLNDALLTSAIVDWAGTKRGEALDSYGRRLRFRPIGINNGRLTLTSGSPITTSDVTAATSIYYTPYIGGKCEIFNGYMWIEAPFTELSLSLSGFTANKNSDIWVYDNAGTLALERTEWTSDTARATALVYQDGRYIKSGATTRLYLGTFRTTGTTGQCEDSLRKRFVANWYNQIDKMLLVTNNSGHTYNTATYRPFNNSQANSQVEFVSCLGLELLFGEITAFISAASGNSTAYAGFSIDSTTSSFSQTITIGPVNLLRLSAPGMTTPGVGYHYLCMLEYSNAGGTAPTFDSASMMARSRF